MKIESVRNGKSWEEIDLDSNQVPIKSFLICGCTLDRFDLPLIQVLNFICRIMTWWNLMCQKFKIWKGNCSVWKMWKQNLAVLIGKSWMMMDSGQRTHYLDVAMSILQIVMLKLRTYQVGSCFFFPKSSTTE